MRFIHNNRIQKKGLGVFVRERSLVTQETATGVSQKFLSRLASPMWRKAFNRLAFSLATVRISILPSIARASRSIIWKIRRLVVAK